MTAKVAGLYTRLHARRQSATGGQTDEVGPERPGGEAAKSGEYAAVTGVDVDLFVGPLEALT
jgi:hypothetical protein